MTSSPAPIPKESSARWSAPVPLEVAMLYSELLAKCSFKVALKPSRVCDVSTLYTFR
jgi:hypothetical protein